MKNKCQSLTTSTALACSSSQPGREKVRLSTSGWRTTLVRRMQEELYTLQHR